jgi:hypothetical protein
MSYPLVVHETYFEPNISRLLLPIQLEKARCTVLIENACRNMSLTRTGPRTFTAKFLQNLSNVDRECFNATIGERVVFRANGVTEMLFVKALTADGLQLTYPDLRDFTKQQNSNEGPLCTSFIYRAKDLTLYANFRLANFRFKVQETAIIDGWTACGGTWFEGEGNKQLGLPMVIIDTMFRSYLYIVAFH